MNAFLLYIDPGSGSYLLQVIIAAILGVSIYFKTIWLKIKMFFGSKRKQDESGNQPGNEQL